MSNYPYHINPTTGRANKCYTVTKCKFGIDEASHFETAAEALNSNTTTDKVDADKVAHDFARTHDEKIYELTMEQNKCFMYAMADLKRLAHRLKITMNRSTSFDDIFAKAEVAAEDLTGYRRDDYFATIKNAKDKIAQSNSLQDEIHELEKAYTGWSRFFLVPGGHIHSSTRCHTCNRNWDAPTQFAWLPSLSGKTDAMAVAEHGALLCTACFPDAPTEWTDHYEKMKEDKQKELCEGSGTWDYPKETARRGYYSGNYGVCNTCGQRVTITATDKLRSHKPVSNQK
jgi:hypothetical protein